MQKPMRFTFVLRSMFEPHQEPMRFVLALSFCLWLLINVYLWIKVTF